MPNIKYNNSAYDYLDWLKQQSNTKGIFAQLPNEKLSNNNLRQLWNNQELYIGQLWRDNFSKYVNEGKKKKASATATSTPSAAQSKAINISTTSTNTPPTVTSNDNILTYSSSNLTDDYDKNWKFSGNTNAWGDGGNKGEVSDKFTEYDATKYTSYTGNNAAEKLQNFLKSQGYNVKVDGYAGNQTLEAWNDYLKREESKVKAEQQAKQTALNNLDKFQPAQRQYTDQGVLNEKYSFNADDIKNSGITNFASLNNFYKNSDNQNSNLWRAIDAYTKVNPSVLKDGSLNQENFESALDLHGRYFAGDRKDLMNNIYSALNNKDNKDDTNAKAITNPYLSASNYNKIFNKENPFNASNLRYYTDNNNKYTVYNNNGTYYKIDNNKLQSVQPIYQYDNGKYNVKFNRGGILMNKYQQGGQMGQQDQLDQIISTTVAALQGDKKAAQMIQQASQQSEQIKTIVQMIAQELQNGSQPQEIKQKLVQAIQGQVQSARQGAKLNYLRTLKNQCPEGYELGYFKAGGRVCHKCVKKATKAACGSKMKIKKKANGGITDTMNQIKVELAKCGKKIRKAQYGEDDETWIQGQDMVIPNGDPSKNKSNNSSTKNPQQKSTNKTSKDEYVDVLIGHDPKTRRPKYKRMRREEVEKMQNAKKEQVAKYMEKHGYVNND